MADKYELPDLSNIVGARLSSALTVENVARTISFADRHQCNFLKDVAVKFAIKSPATFAQVRLTDDFKKLDADCLVALLDALNGTTSETSGKPLQKKRKVSAE